MKQKHQNQNGAACGTKTQIENSKTLEIEREKQ